MSTIEIAGNSVHVDAQLIASDLGLEPERVLEAMRAGRLTAICEQGVDQDAGRVRLTFYHERRRVRLIVDQSGHVLERSAGRLRARRRAAQSTKGRASDA